MNNVPNAFAPKPSSGRVTTAASDQHLSHMQVDRKTGQELFENTSQPGQLTLSDFWAWSASDIIGNTERGALAEFIVGSAIGADTIDDGVRDGWAPYDLKADGILVEVKAAAYIQSWDQAEFSVISFGYPKTRKWNPKTNAMEDEPTRVADVYVFCLLKHKDQATLNPLDMAQWEFYVVPTAVLDGRKRSQSSVTLASLQKFCDPVPYQDLRNRVHDAAAFTAAQELLDSLDNLGCDWSKWPKPGCRIASGCDRPRLYRDPLPQPRAECCQPQPSTC